MEKVTTAHRLKQLMDSRGLRQVDILNAAKPHCLRYGVKLGKNDLSQYVSGKVVPGQDKLTILGLALNVSEAWLMGYDVSPDRSYAPISDTSVIFDPCDKLFIPLKEMRMARGLTENEVAAKIGISLSDYQQIEDGASTSCSVLIRLAEYFCCSTDHLLSFDGVFGRNGHASSSEYQLVHKFRQLNTEGQNALLVQLDFFLEQDIYKNEPIHNSIQKNA